MSKVILFVTMSLWDEPHRGRHHYANVLSQRHTVLWVNRHLGPDEKGVKPGIQHIKDGLYVIHVGNQILPTRIDNRLNINNRFRLQFVRREMKRLELGKPDVVWCYDYKAIQFINAYRDNAVCIYLCNDWTGEWTSRFGEWACPMHEKKIASSVDHVIAVSTKLCTRFTSINNNVHFVPHGLWLPEVTPVYVKKAQPEILGYIGTLNNTIDTDFLEKILDDTGLELLLAGPIIEASPSKTKALRKLIDHPRVRYLGNLGRQEADAARAVPDVLLLPYVKSIVREYGFPIKFFEYLGTGKFIVSTDYMEWPDLFRDSVCIYREHVDIRACIAQGYNLWDQDCFNNAIELSRKSTWEQRVNTISELTSVEL
jgi:glycosyltransferase involved in cell wall biosynthesis